MQAATRLQSAPLPMPSPPPSPPPQEERRGLQQQVAQLAAAVEAQDRELADYAGNDPDRYDRLSALHGGPAWLSCPPAC